MIVRVGPTQRLKNGTEKWDTLAHCFEGMDDSRLNQITKPVQLA